MEIFSEIYVHWSMEKFDTSRLEGEVFTYKGLQNAFDALNQSFDSGKWDNKTPTLILFDFSTIEFLKANTRFEIASQYNKPYNEKSIESFIHQKVREAGKQGWSAKYVSWEENAEYVVFNEFINESMIIKGNKKRDIIDTFIKFCRTEVEQYEEKINFINIEDWISATTQNFPREWEFDSNFMMRRKSQAQKIKKGLTKKQLRTLTFTIQDIDRLAKNVRILSIYSGLPKKYFSVFEKYNNYKEDKIVHFDVFPKLYFKLRF